MLYVSILQSLGGMLHCAGVCLHPVRVHACNALSNNFSSCLSLLSSGFEFHFAELSFLSLRIFFLPPKACYTEGGMLANSLCSLGDSLELWLLSGSSIVVYKSLTHVQWHYSLPWLNIFPRISWDLKLMKCSKTQMQKKAKAISLCWEKLNIEAGPSRVRRGGNIKREEVSYLNITLFCAVQ